MPFLENSRQYHGDHADTRGKPDGGDSGNNRDAGRAQRQLVFGHRYHSFSILGISLADERILSPIDIYFEGFSR